MLISIDPGLRMCGVAVWSDVGQLAKAGLVRGDAKAKDSAAWSAMVQSVKTWICDQAWALGWSPWTGWVSEFPKVYAVGKSKGDPEDLLQLAGVVGGFAGLWGPATNILRPYEWKRQVPKAIMTERIKSKLTPGELERVDLPAPSYAHNVWDAVGIGLAHLGRLR